MQQIKWTERKFQFGYSSGYAPLMIERLKATGPRLEELLGSAGDELAGVRTAGWSAKEHAGHLVSLEQLHDGRIDDFVAGLAGLRPADMSNAATNEADYNSISVTQILARFREGRSRYLARVAALDEAVLERTSLHPRLQQQVTFTDMLYFVAEHDTHHLALIAALLRE